MHILIYVTIAKLYFDWGVARLPTHADCRCGMAERREQQEEENRAELVSVGKRERISSETRAEVAREFRKTLNRKRPSRKRYSLSSAHYSRQQSSTSSNSLQASGRQFDTSPTASLSSSARGFASTTYFDSNPFVSSVRPTGDGGGGVSLGVIEGGGEAIYREFEEYESLSEVKNKFRRMIPQPVRKSLIPPRSWRDWKRFVLVHLPIIHWLWTYRSNQLIGDLIAGITIGVTHIPQGDPVMHKTLA